MSTNAGSKRNDAKAEVPGIGDVWFDKEAIANILSLHLLAKKHRITYDSAKEDAFIVHQKTEGLSSEQVKMVFNISNLNIEQERVGISISDFSKIRKSLSCRNFRRFASSRNPFPNSG